MKVVILAGGMGTRLAEETEVRPKPMVEIGEHPILWHIMKLYGHFGFREFVIALGYKGEIIKRYFLDNYSLTSDFTVNMATGEVETRKSAREDWLVHLVDTGRQTNTGGRLKRLETLLHAGRFMLTYGDGIGDIDIKGLVGFHRKQNRLVTVTAVRPPARFGGLVLDQELALRFTEKPQVGEGWINGGFMVLEPDVFKYLQGDESRLEQDLLSNLATSQQLAAYRHAGFWQCMDTLNDKRVLQRLWEEERPPWKLWH